jgi:hypothetical protein
MIITHLSIPTAPLANAVNALRVGTLPAVRSAFEEIAIEQVQVVEARLPDSYVRLRRSIQVSRPELLRRIPLIRIGSNQPEARITHFGGTIETFEARGLPVPAAAMARRAFPGKPIHFLTVPLTRIGVPEFARARDYQNLFVWKPNREADHAYLAQRLVTASNIKTREEVTGFARAKRDQAGRFGALQKPKKGEKFQGFRLLFALLEKVVIKPHPYLYWSDPDISRAQRILFRHLQDLASK